MIKTILTVFISVVIVSIQANSQQQSLTVDIPATIDQGALFTATYTINSPKKNTTYTVTGTCTNCTPTSNTCTVVVGNSAPASQSCTIDFTAPSTGSSVTVNGSADGGNGSGCVPCTGSDNAVLPVEFTSFEATLSNNVVYLQWSTKSELNNEKFVIQRSDDGKDYVSLAEVTGAGTTLENKDYQYNDDSPNPGINYYRLKQIDYDGYYDYSDVIVVSVSSLEAQIYPNPSNGKIKIIAADESVFTIYDIAGRPLKSGTINNNENIDISDISNGLYIIKVKAGNLSYTTRIVKQ